MNLSYENKKSDPRVIQGGPVQLFIIWTKQTAYMSNNKTIN